MKKISMMFVMLFTLLGFAMAQDTVTAENRELSAQVSVKQAIQTVRNDRVDSNPTTTFSINLTPLVLPGGKASVAGMESGVALTVTPNLDLRELNLTGSSFNFFGAGANYRFPAVSRFIGNHTLLNGLDFQFYGTGTVGVVNALNGPAGGHWGEMVGGGVNYSINGVWSLGAELQYAKLPGYANNTYTVAIGPQIHF
jgi:hypothetical protein